MSRSDDGSLPARFSPVSPSERIELLDVLRGVALFGILVVNMAWLSMPSTSIILGDLFAGTATKIFNFVAHVLVVGKANAIFSFMFGLGVTIQMRRASERGQTLAPMFVRRMSLLFVLGLAHVTLLWTFDVLHHYAILGLVLLALRRAPDRAIVVLFVLCFVFPIGRAAFGLVTHEAPIFTPEELAALSRVELEVFTGGTYVDQIEVRWTSVARIYGLSRSLHGPVVDWPMIFSTMLMGLMAGRKRIFEGIEAKLDAVRKATFIGLGVGWALALTKEITGLVAEPSPDELSLASFVGLLFLPSRMCLCVGYIGGIVLLFQRPRWRRILSVLGPAGRLPLTNYLMQTVLATILFSNFGFGLYAQIGPAPSFGISVAIFTLQVIYSRWWVARFRFGPLEWLWRGASYGKLPRLRS